MRSSGAGPAVGAALVLAFGVACVSTAAVLIRLAQAEVSSLAIAAYRMAFAAAILVPIALAKGGLGRLSGGERRRVVAAGGVLAAHFALWIASLEHTSVASSVVLVTTNPLFVALAEPVVFRTRLRGGLVAGILVAVLGAAVVGLGDAGHGPHALGGDGLALAGAMAAAAYFLIGRSVRARVGLLPYVTRVYATAAALLVAAALATGEAMVGYSAETWGTLVLLAAVPQVLGHSSFNWALRHLSASLVSGAVVAEALGSTLLAWWLLGEAPPATALGGGLLIVAGLALAVRDETRRVASAARG